MIFLNGEFYFFRKKFGFFVKKRRGFLELGEMVFKKWLIMR